MELNKVEVAAVERIVERVESLEDLNDLQLALVGGGIGTVVVG